MKSPIKWKIWCYATEIYDYGWPIITPIADFIRDITFEYEDHKD